MAQAKTKNKNKAQAGFWARKHKYILKLVLATIIFIVLVVCVRVFLLNRTVFKDKTPEDVFEAPLQSEVPEEQVRVTKNRNAAREEFSRFSNFQDPREILFDNDTLWVATGNGLVKYNKSRKEIIKIYTEADGLPDNILTSLAKYKDKIFLGTQGGLSIFDPAEETFVNYLNKEEWRYNNNLNDFIIRDDNLWISTFGGFRRYDIEQNKWYNFSRSDVELTLYQDSLFFIESGMPENSRIFKVPLEAKGPGDVSIAFQDPECSFADLDASENLVLACCNLREVGGSKVYRFKSEEEGWTEIPKLVLGQGEYYGFGSMHLAGDEVFLTEIQADGSAYFVSYHLQTEDKIYLDLPDEIRDQGARPIAFFEGLIWFGSDRNLEVYDPASGDFGSLREGRDFPLSIHGILAQDQDLVLANTDLGVGLIDFKRGEWQVIDEGVKDRASGVFKGDDIWFVSYNSGMGSFDIDLIHYNLKQETKETWPIEDDSELAGQLILAEDRKLWVGSTEILLYDVDLKRFEVFDDFPVEVEYLLFTKPRLSDSKIWFGFVKPYGEQGGLGSFDLREKEYSFVNLPQNYDIAPHGGVLTLPAGEIYFTPSDYKEEGIYVYDLETKGVRTINTDNSQIEQDGITLLAYQDNLLALKVKGKIPLAKVGRSVDTFLEQNYQVGLEIYDLPANQWYFFDAEEGLIDNEIEDVLIGDQYIYILAGGVTVIDKDF